MANSERWGETIADVLKKTIVLADTDETAALGAVMLLYVNWFVLVIQHHNYI